MNARPDEWQTAAPSRLKYALRAATLRLTVARLQILLGKANFNPNQPRVPKGRREGGQWTHAGAGEQSNPKIETDESGRPKFPERRPASSRFRYLLSRAVASWLVELAVTSPPAQFWRAGHWIDESAPAIWSYLDRPKPLAELQRRAQLTPKRRGYAVHHIVEQTPARQEEFRESLIEGENNLVLVPTYRHIDITAWYMKRNPDFGDLSPRAYLRGKSWEERKRVGLMALRLYGVLEP